jgi:hypothetical protein
VGATQQPDADEVFLFRLVMNGLRVSAETSSRAAGGSPFACSGPSRVSPPGLVPRRPLLLDRISAALDAELIAEIAPGAA